MFKDYLLYKAASAGREIRFVDPAYTSKCCSNCGAEFENFDLSTRWVNCACGLSLDRDHNAAINILIKAGWCLGAASLPSVGEADPCKHPYSLTWAASPSVL